MGDTLAIKEVIAFKNPATQEASPAGKQRLTFYATKPVRDIIEMVKAERGDDSITDAVCQIIIEYGTQRNISRIEREVNERFSRILAEYQSLKLQNETLRDRLSLVEARCASVNREVLELKTGCKDSSERDVLSLS